MEKSWIIGLVCLLLTACQGDPSLEDTASEICTCIQNIPELNHHLAQRLPEADQEELTDLLAALSMAASESRQCLADHKLPSRMEDPRLEMLLPFLNEKCPGWQQILESLPPQVDL